MANYVHHCRYCTQPSELYPDQITCETCNDLIYGCKECMTQKCTYCSSQFCPQCSVVCKSCKKLTCNNCDCAQLIDGNLHTCCEKHKPRKVWTAETKYNNTRLIKYQKRKQMIAHQTYMSMKAIRKNNEQLIKRDLDKQFRKKIDVLFKDFEDKFTKEMENEGLEGFNNLSFFK